MTNKLQENYGKLLDARLIKEVTSQFLFNKKYEGEAKAGVVHIPVRGGAKVQEYVVGQGIELNQVGTSYIPFAEFKDLAVNEILDGFEKDAVPDKVIADRLESAAQELAVAIDENAYKTLEEEGTMLNLKTDEAFKQVLEARTALSNAGVPVTGRKLAVSPDFAAQLMTSPQFVANIGEEMRSRGAIGTMGGFEVYETAYLKDAMFIALHPDWATSIEDWIKTPYLADLSNSSNHIGDLAIKGRIRIGHKITNPKAVLVGKIIGSKLGE